MSLKAIARTQKGRWEGGYRSEYTGDVKVSNLEVMISCKVYGKEWSWYKQCIKPIYTEIDGQEHKECLEFRPAQKAEKIKEFDDLLEKIYRGFLREILYDACIEVIAGVVTKVAGLRCFHFKYIKSRSDIFYQQIYSFVERDCDLEYESDFTASEEVKNYLEANNLFCDDEYDDDVYEDLEDECNFF